MMTLLVTPDGNPSDALSSDPSGDPSSDHSDDPIGDHSGDPSGDPRRAEPLNPSNGVP